MFRIVAEKIVRFVLLVLLVEFFSASFFTTPAGSPKEDVSFNVQHDLLQPPAFLTEQEEKHKEYNSISIAIRNGFRPENYLATHHNLKDQSIPFLNRPPRFALFHSILI